MNAIPFQSEPVPPEPKQSFAGFDAVRALAALGVVLLHACVPYLKNPMPGLVWSVRDTPSETVDRLFWGIEVFIMPIFLVLAGYLAWQTLSRRGPKSLVSSRTKRLLLPFFFAVCVVLPIDLYIWVLAWVGEGTVEAVKLKSLKFDGVVDKDLWGFGHLWFLHYLFFYVVITSVIFKFDLLRMICAKFSRSPVFAAAGLCLVGFCTLSIAPEVVWGFQHEFYPVPSKFLYSGTFFAGGLLIASVDPSFAWFRERARVMVVLSVMLLASAVLLGQWHLAHQENALASQGLAFVTVLAAWSVTLTLVSSSLSITRLSTPIAYLAAASFWVYLVHHPILGLVHFDLKGWIPGISPVVKITIAFAVSVGLSLATYEAFVRRSRLGKWLGMNWKHPDRQDECLLRMPSESETPQQNRVAA